MSSGRQKQKVSELSLLLQELRDDKDIVSIELRDDHFDPRQLIHH
jgi:hypothetical protein